MNDRLKLIVSVAALIAALIFAGTSYFQRQNRLKSAFELRDERVKENRAREEAEMRASATTPEQKMLVSFYLDHDRQKERRSFQLGREVSQYHAWLLAADYFGCNFGVCGAVGLPKKNGDQWEIECLVGAPPGVRTAVFVHTRTGIVTCKDHPTIYDAEAFMAHPEMPNTERSAAP